MKRTLREETGKYGGYILTQALGRAHLAAMLPAPWGEHGAGEESRSHTLSQRCLSKLWLITLLCMRCFLLCEPKNVQWAFPRNPMLTTSPPPIIAEEHISCFYAMHARAGSSCREGVHAPKPLPLIFPMSTVCVVHGVITTPVHTFKTLHSN